MQSKKEARRRTSSNGRTRLPNNSELPPPSATSTTELIFDLENLNFSDDNNNNNNNNNNENNPRSFPYSVKQQCWDKADKIKGRDPQRWRRDTLGNTIFRKLVGCPGCLCHDYDHILPYSKGGKSTLDNCQVLQATVNRSKGNRTDIPRSELIRRSSYCRVSGRDMDLLELSAYGNVRRGEDSGGCRIQ